jgi:hypothetical protein
MAIDVRTGDLLVVDGREYPIVGVGDWEMAHQSPGFARMATKTATVKRTPTAGGKRGAPVALPGLTLSCTPLDPYDNTKQGATELQTPFVGLQTFATDSSGFVHIILENLKR